MPVIATNTSANTALIYLNRNSEDQAKSLSKLSSGSRIVSASDDAAGLAVASRLSADITTLQQSGQKCPSRSCSSTNSRWCLGTYW